MAPLVLDASVTMTWCFPDEHSDFAWAVLDHLERNSAVVPVLWPIEVANAILVGERRRRLSASESARFLKLLSGLAIHVDTRTAESVFPRTLPVARTYGLSAYDASYLELAMREELPLATLDERLQKAAADAGVVLYKPL